MMKESVTAAIGAGLTTACVVDVGHEKTVVSCVEDGIAIPGSRYSLPFILLTQ